MSLSYLMLLTKEVFDVLKMRKIKRKSLNKFQQRIELKEKPLEEFDRSKINYQNKINLLPLGGFREQLENFGLTV